MEACVIELPISFLLSRPLDTPFAHFQPSTRQTHFERFPVIEREWQNVGGMQMNSIGTIELLHTGHHLKLTGRSTVIDPSRESLVIGKAVT